MATKPVIDLAKLLGKRGYGAEVQRQRRQEAEERSQARNILDPLDVAGEYDAARLLYTTLGGELRPITLDDLQQFAHLARKLGKRFKGGITARGVVDASLPVDRERANAEIRTAVVVKAQAGALHFVTNAGPASKVTRHHVHVEFPAFKAYAASPQAAAKLSRAMLDGPLRFECDCERHRYWFRYIATKGGFNAGRPEVGFPKIRNPKLVGVACKHALRVMQAVMRDANVRAQATAMIAAAQKNDTRAKTVTAAEAKAAAQKQLAQAHHLKNRVETKAEIDKRRASTPAARARAMMKAAAEAQKRAAAEAAQSRKALEVAFAKLKSAPLTKAMRDALIAKLMAANTID